MARCTRLALLVVDGYNVVHGTPRYAALIDEHAGADTYISLPCAGYVVTESEQADALDKAKADLVKRMMDFDYEHQL